jgi:RIO kinase 3
MPKGAGDSPSSTVAIPPSTTSCPWKKTEPVVNSTSFQELMDSDLAEKLQKEEDKKFAQEINQYSKTPIESEISVSTEHDDDDDDDEHPIDPSAFETNDDYLLALMLQHEYNNEFNGMMKKYESTVNRNSKIKVSMKNFMLLPAARSNPTNDNDEEEDIEVPQETFSDCEQDERMPTFNRRGTSGTGDSLVTKHNAELCGKRNVARVMNTFPPEFDTGNVLNNTPLSNRIYNQLKLHSYAQEKRMNRLHDKVEKATANLAFDPKTRIILYKSLNACILNEIGSIIATGKESIVLYGKGGQTEQYAMPEEVAIKIFKTTLNEYHTREKYLREDYRFRNRYKSLNSRKIVKLWAEKEMFNLQRLQRAGIPCPTPVLLKKYVLFLSFIGKDGTAAPRLRDAILTPEELANAYQQCLNLLKRIYHDCKLIHADFSEYNLLWYDNIVYVIDVAQSVEPYHPNAYTYLLRDCTNLSTFFSRRTLNEHVLSPEETFNYITGLSFEKRGEEFLNEVQAYEKNIRLQSEAVKEKENFSFDYFFNQNKQLQDNDDSSSDEDDDDNDENYTDLTSGDEYLTKSSPPTMNKSPLRKPRVSKHSS